MVEGLVTAGVKPLRVGYGGKVKESLFTHTLDYKMKTHPLAAQLREATKQADEVEKNRENLLIRIADLRASGTSSKFARLVNMENAALALERRLGALRGKAYRLYQHMLREIVHGSDVVRILFVFGVSPYSQHTSGLHDLYHGCFGSAQCLGFSHCFHRRGIDVYRTCHAYTFDERRAYLDPIGWHIH